MIKELVTYAKTYKPFTGGDNGLYVSRILEPYSSSRLIDFVHRYSLTEMTDRDIDKLHCTIMYSPLGIVRGVDSIDRSDLDPVVLPCSARIIAIETWPGHDDSGYLVAVLQSQALQHIHKLWKLRGGVSTFEEYHPHITIQHPFDIDDKSLIPRMMVANESLAHNPIVVKLSGERVEDIKTD